VQAEVAQPSVTDVERRAAAAAPARAWHSLVRLYQDAENSRWGRPLLSNVWPAYVFALPLGARLAGDAGRLKGMSTAVLAQEAATVLFQALIVLLFVIRRPVIGSRADWRGGIVALLGTFLLNVVAFLPISDSVGSSQLFTSAIVTFVGTLFTTWSLASLGRCFGIFPEVRGLVTRGPYHWVRHPVYLGELVSGLGIAVAKPNALVLAFIAAFVVLQFWRMGLEERALSMSFPVEYPAYRARTGRLLPRWR
jgi:protein-S-isoprenylcysteine O-methyltransferase Ste14